MSKSRTGFVPEMEAVKYVAYYRIAYPEYGFARSAEEAVRIADLLGYPVVLKIVSPDVLHNTDVG